MYIRAVFQQVRREGVAQRMGGDVLFDAGLCLIGFDELPEALAGHALPADIDEQRLFIRRSDHPRADELRILAEGLDRGVVKRDHAVMVPAVAGDDAGGEIQIVDIEIDELADANACGIQQLQHRAVAIAFRVDALRLLQQQLHFLAGEDLRQLLRGLVRNEDQTGVFGNDIVFQEERIKTLDRGDRAGNRRNGFPRGLQRGDIGAEILLGGFFI